MAMSRIAAKWATFVLLISHSGAPGSPANRWSPITNLVKQVSVDGNLRELSPEPRVFWAGGGRTLATIARGGDRSGRAISELYKSGAVTTLATGLEPATDPKGSRLSFFGEDGHLHVGEITAHRYSEWRQIEMTQTDTSSTWSNGERRHVWSPAGDQVAYVKTSKSQLSDGNVVRPVSTELWLYSHGDDKMRRIYTSSGVISAVSWLPQGDKIVFSQERTGGNQFDDISAELVMVEVASGNASVLSNQLGRFASRILPVASPNGDYIAVGFDPYQLTYTRGIVPAVVDTRTGRLLRQSHPYYMVPNNPVRWINGSKLAYLCKLSAAQFSVCRWNLRTGKTDVEALARFSRVNAFVLSGNDEIIYGAMDWLDRGAIFAQRRGKIRSIFGDPPAHRRTSRGRIADFRWTSFDGLQLSGLVLYPPRFVRGRRYPLVVDIHGGPTGGIDYRGSILNRTPLEWQLWTDMGYVVFVADYRESNIYGFDDRFVFGSGQTFVGDENAFDVLAGIRKLEHLGIADLKRVAVLGFSAGALTVNAMVTHDRSIAAAVSKEGFFSWSIELPPPTSDRYQSLLRVFKTDGVHLPARLEASSPARHLDKIRTPMLIIGTEYGVGEEGAGVADQLRRRGIEARFLYLRREPHDIASTEGAERALTQSVKWITRHFQ